MATTKATSGVRSLGTGEIAISNIADDAVTLAKMAAGTDGNLISYDTNGDPVAVATGTSGQVLTSNGVGTAPTMQDAGGVIQSVNVQDGAVATGTTIMPEDDTIPQNTEGTEFITLSITPQNTANILYIDAVVNLNHNLTSLGLMAALFQDTTANALAVAGMTQDPTNHPEQLILKYRMVAGTTSATTFKIRCGSGTAGTITFNGWGSARKFGGVFLSSITIREETP